MPTSLTRSVNSVIRWFYWHWRLIACEYISKSTRRQRRNAPVANFRVAKSCNSGSLILLGITMERSVIYSKSLICDIFNPTIRGSIGGLESDRPDSDISLSVDSIGTVERSCEYTWKSTRRQKRNTPVANLLVAKSRNSDSLILLGITMEGSVR